MRNAAYSRHHHPLSCCDHHHLLLLLRFASRSFARAPVERVKNVMQVRNSGGVHAPYTSSMACARALVRDLGFMKGLYTGFGSTVAREIPQYVFYFMAYDKSKELLEANHAALGISSHFVPVISGGIAGTMCWIPPFYSIGERHLLYLSSGALSAYDNSMQTLTPRHTTPHHTTPHHTTPHHTTPHHTAQT